MRSVRAWGALLILLIAFFISAAFSEGIISSDKAEWYRKGQISMELENYADAMEAFTQADDFEDSKTLLVFCRGMVLLKEADEFEKKGYLSDMSACLDKTEDYFNLLSGIEYGESKKYLRYIQARRYEAKGLTQKALDMYAELFGICDSDERYLRLKDGIVIQPVMTPAVSQNTLNLISAQVYQETNTYDGPGSSYRKDAIIITPDMPVSIVGQSGEWYLVETFYDKYKVRLWIPKIRAMRKESAEPFLLEINASGIINSETELYYGPGQEYLSMGIVLQRNMLVSIIAEDGIYTLIEFVNELDQLPIRGWLMSVNLTKK